MDHHSQQQAKDLARLEADFTLQGKELDRLRREQGGRLEDLRRLEAENRQSQGCHYEARVEELEKEFRKTEGVRKDYLLRLEYAQAQWECKLRLFVKEGEDRGRQSAESLRRIA